MKRISIFLGLLLAGCSSSDPKVDTIAPEVHMNFTGAFPAPCQILERGLEYTFKMRFTDNEELGSFSIDIHNNFDHHTHSTDESITCQLDPKKEKVNPLVFVRDYPIPAGQQDYTAEAKVSIPQGVDAGDYHLSIKLTDSSGWSTWERISIKIK